MENNINIEDFQKVDLRIGRVLVAEAVPDSDKLIRLEVDLGEDPPTHSTSVQGCPEEFERATGSGRERRQIVAGIKGAYAPEELVGQEIVVVANLEPRKLRGLESQGMLLAAHDADGKPIILTVEREVPPGARVS